MRSLQLRLFLAGMPLLAGLHEAFTAAGRHVEQHQGINWFSTFCGEAAVRLPISLVLAFAIFALVSAAGALLLRLDGASVSAEAARYNIDLKKIAPVITNPNQREFGTRRVSGVRSFQLGRVA
jgi:hypothetical protein